MIKLLELRAMETEKQHAENNEERDNPPGQDMENCKLASRGYLLPISMPEMNSLARCLDA